MCLVEMNIFCYDRLPEDLSDELEHIELLVKEIVHHILLSFYKKARFGEVIVTPSSLPTERQHMYTIRIRALCSHDAWCTEDSGKIELTLEEKISVVLMELFEAVEIEQVIIKPTQPPGLVA